MRISNIYSLHILKCLLSLKPHRLKKLLKVTILRYFGFWSFCWLFSYVRSNDVLNRSFSWLIQKWYQNMLRKVCMMQGNLTVLEICAKKWKKAKSIESPFMFFIRFYYFLELWIKGLVIEVLVKKYLGSFNFPIPLDAFCLSHMAS